jgi:hypothetical protein
MVGVGAGRVDQDATPQAFLLNETTEDAMRRRRSADVAHADEKYRNTFLFFQLVLHFSLKSASSSHEA